MEESTGPPIILQVRRPLELLLQASSPPRCDGYLDRIVRKTVDDVDLQQHHHHRPTLVNKSTPVIFYTTDVVNTDFSSQGDSSVYDHRSETATSLISTISVARYHTSGYQPSFYSLQEPSRQSSITTYRSLINFTDASESMMAATASVPGSPPDLSGSRSSKSSSTCSTSQEYDPHAIAGDVTNFEDIGLDDDRHGKPEELRGDSLQRAKTAEATVKPVLISNTRPALPSLRTQVKEVAKQNENDIQVKKGSSFASMRRGFSSPITPLANGRPRSNSPPKRIPTYHQSTPALSADVLRPQLSSSGSSLPLPSRRGSWQHRKSVQELEAEYHDSDDELPDDASLWNVPCSPHVGDRSARSSFHASPVREPLPRSPRPIPLGHATTAPAAQIQQTTESQSLPRMRPTPPRSSSLTTSLSNPSSPRSKRFQRAGRAKSWNLAMEDLSEEAKIISEALEHHAEEARRSQLDGAGSDFGHELVSATNANPKAHQIQLPPVQKGNLDFMPISKEKEAILSRTRPSWLPPKDPREERRHLKEYQRMMAASLEAEKKKQEQVQSLQSEKDLSRDALNRIWQYYCDESTDLSVIDKRVFDLCWRGISPKLRGQVWQRAVGNPLGLSSKSYEKALSRAKEIQTQTAGNSGKHERRILRWLNDIERDAETAFPELNLFQHHGPLWQDLIDVCKAYACYRSDVGYSYGQQLTAALLLLQVHKPADAFILLANCFNRPVSLAFQSGEISTTARTHNHAVSTLAIKFPRLHEYLFGSIEAGGLGFTAELIFEPMLRTLFCNGLDLDRLCRFWDLWVFQGDQTLVRTAVAVLGCLQSRIFEVQGDIDLRRRNIQEMLAWGPFNRTEKGGHWNLGQVQEDKFVDEIRSAGELNYRLR